MSNVSFNAKVGLASCFAFAAGWTNVICLVRYSAYGTMMTGNLMMIAVTFCKSGLRGSEDGLLPDPLFYVSIIIWRWLGLLVYYVVDTKLGIKPPSRALSPLIIILTLFMEYVQGAGEQPIYPERWSVWLVAFSFGVQSSVTHPTLAVPVLLCTGHMTSVFHTWMSHFFGGNVKLETTITPSCVITFMLVGGLMGAWADIATASHGNQFLLTPIIILQAFLLNLTDYCNRPAEAPAESALIAKDVESPATAKAPEQLSDDKNDSEGGSYGTLRK